MIAAMAICGDKFKRSEILCPEMLMAAHTMKKGVEFYSHCLPARPLYH
jgi:methanogenic corrinoid protein MtbC1